MVPNLKSLFTVLCALGLASAVVLSTPTTLQNYTRVVKRGTQETWTAGNAYWYANSDPLITFLGARTGEGNVEFYFQNDGNFVIYQDGQGVQWSSGTSGYNCPTGSPACEFVFQGDGNLVIYINGEAKWSSGTDANSGNGETAAQSIVMNSGYDFDTYTASSPFMYILGPYYGEPSTLVMWHTNLGGNAKDPGGPGVPVSDPDPVPPCEPGSNGICGYRVKRADGMGIVNARC